MKKLWLLGILLLAACTSTPRSVFRLPSQSDREYIDPDGRRWFVQSKGSMPGTAFEIAFTPGEIEATAWKERLGFGFSKMDPSPSAQRSLLETFKDLDPKFTYSYEDVGGAYLLVTSSEKFNERAVTKCVPVPGGYFYMSYTERLGEAGRQSFQHWVSVITKIPNEALLPASTIGKIPQ